MTRTCVYVSIQTTERSRMPARSHGHVDSGIAEAKVVGQISRSSRDMVSQEHKARRTPRIIRPDRQRSLNIYIYLYLRNPRIEQIEQRKWVWGAKCWGSNLPDPCERPHRQCFMSAPIHTHTCTHTSITRCMHLLCAARVQTLQFFTLRVSRLHIMRSCTRMLMMHSHIHLPTHTHIFIHTHITTLADTSAISLATTSQHSQARQQEQSQSHSHPLL